MLPTSYLVKANKPRWLSRCSTQKANLLLAIGLLVVEFASYRTRLGPLSGTWRGRWCKRRFRTERHLACIFGA